jgi:hypothetical protein
MTVDNSGDLPWKAMSGEALGELLGILVTSAFKEIAKQNGRSAIFLAPVSMVGFKLSSSLSTHPRYQSELVADNEEDAKMIVDAVVSMQKCLMRRENQLLEDVRTETLKGFRRFCAIALMFFAGLFAMLATDVPQVFPSAFSIVALVAFAILRHRAETRARREISVFATDLPRLMASAFAKIRAFPEKTPKAA